MMKFNSYWDLMKELIGFTVSMFIMAGWFCAFMYVLMDITRNIVLFCK